MVPSIRASWATPYRCDEPRQEAPAGFAPPGRRAGRSAPTAHLYARVIDTSARPTATHDLPDALLDAPADALAELDAIFVLDQEPGR